MARVTQGLSEDQTESSSGLTVGPSLSALSLQGSQVPLTLK